MAKSDLSMQCWYLVQPWYILSSTYIRERVFGLLRPNVYWHYCNAAMRDLLAHNRPSLKLFATFLYRCDLFKARPRHGAHRAFVLGQLQVVRALDADASNRSDDHGGAYGEGLAEDAFLLPACDVAKGDRTFFNVDLLCRRNRGKS